MFRVQDVVDLAYAAAVNVYACAIRQYIHVYDSDMRGCCLFGILLVVRCKQNKGTWRCGSEDNEKRREMERERGRNMLHVMDLGPTVCVRLVVAVAPMQLFFPSVSLRWESRGRGG